MKLLDSYKNYLNHETNEILICHPSFMFKLYIYFLRLYIPKDIWNVIEFLDSYEKINDKYDFGLDNENFDNFKIKYTATKGEKEVVDCDDNIINTPTSDKPIPILKKNHLNNIDL